MLLQVAIYLFSLIFRHSILAILSSKCATNRSMRVVAYLNASAGVDSRLDMTKGNAQRFVLPTEAQAKYLTHLIYSSALVDLNRNLTLINPEYFAYFRDQMRHKHPHLKLLISIASDQDLDFTFTMPNYPETRAIFRRNIIDFILANHLDGVDIDWEHSLSISAKYMTQEDKSSIFTLLEELRGDLNELSSSSRPLLLTLITAKRPGGFFFMDHWELQLQKALKIVDFISVKAYGYNSHWDVFTAPSSPLYFDPDSPITKNGLRANVHWSMTHYACRTNELHKLNMMVALNGYFWQSKKIMPISNDGHGQEENSLYRKVAVPFQSGLLEWRDIQSMYGPMLNATGYDARAEVEFLMPDEKTFFIFENEQTIRAKVLYAQKYGLGGFSIYSINADRMDETNSLTYLLGKTASDVARICGKIEKYNCTVVQDEQCIVEGRGHCRIANECLPPSNSSNKNGNGTEQVEENSAMMTSSHFGSKYVLNNEKCPSAGVSDVVCCPSNFSSVEFLAISTSFSSSLISGSIYWFPILAFLLVVITFLMIVQYRRKKKSPLNLDSVNSGTTVTTAIHPTNDGEQNVQIDWINLVRTERPKMDVLSTLNDLAFLNDNEFGHKWSEIERNSSRLTINGMQYADFQPSKEFKKLCELGKGNFSQVNKYEFRGIQIAVKQVRLYAGSEEMKRAFVDLAVLGACKCPFITQYYGYYIEPEHIHICMEPMATCFWKILEYDLLRQRGIPETAVGKVAFSVCKALEYLRSKHAIMHRDVKPSNILLCSKGVKLCDFGIAGRLNESRAFTACIGCLAYMAPERINSENIYDIKADVWSVGVTAIELITGKHPFEASDEIEMLMKIAHEAPSIRAPVDPFSPEFAHFYRSCLHRDFQKRPNYKELLEMHFLKSHERIPAEVVWNWYKRLMTTNKKTSVDTSPN